MTKEQKELYWDYNHLIIRYPNNRDERILNLAIQYGVEMEEIERRLNEADVARNIDLRKKLKSMRPYK